jgi:hypothetical protein
MHLLYFTAEDHYLYHSSRGRLELEARFSDDELGVSEFREHLRGRKGALFAVVADVAGEDFHEEQVPLLRGGDRRAVVERRLAQRYRDTRLVTALSLGAVRGPQRRNERLLLASFTNTQQFAPWLDALGEADARLAGVYSAPLLAPVLAARLGARGPRTLVISANRAGLRQSFVEDGKLRFARLERIVDLAPRALAAFARSETVRLAQYLTTLRVLPRDGAPLPALVIAPPGERAVFEQALVSDARVVFRTIDSAQALSAVGLRRVAEGTGAEALYLHLAARKPPRAQFANREDRRSHSIWQLQRAVVAAGALGLAACAVYAGARTYEGYELRGRAAAQSLEARLAAERYARITASFPVTETTTENLRLTVVEFQRIAQASATPEPSLVHVSRVLAQFPQIELENVGWSIGRPEERRERKPAAQPAKPEAQSEAVLLEVSGRVRATQRNDYRGITAQVQSFAGTLAASGYTLVRTQLPFDITSEGTLTGDIGGADSGEAPRFTVLLARRLP